MNRYLELMKERIEKANCMRRRYYCVITDNNGNIITEGYNSVPKNELGCEQIGSCERIIKNIPSGTRYDLCRSIHAEQRAILNIGISNIPDGAKLYLYGIDSMIGEMSNPKPCDMCKRFIKEAGIKTYINISGEYDINTDLKIQ